MLELICDQSFTWDGVPADKSPYHNDGRATHTGGSFDGVQPGSGMITFPHPDSRVRISTGLAWQPLISLKIEILARVDPMMQRTPTLVAGQGSFRFGLMEGALEARFENATGSHNHVRSDQQFAPDHNFHRVPTNKWVRLGFDHDGFAKMRLFIDGELVGETIVEGGIPPVQGLGVSIGNDVDRDGSQFPGEIDELRIWRLDPKAPKRAFLSRPYTRQTARCWRQYWESTIAWARRNQEQGKSLTQQIQGEQEAVVRSILLLPDSEQAKLGAVLTAFSALWRAGNISGPEMAKVLCDWFALLRGAGIEPGGDAATSAALAAAFAGRQAEAKALLRCDRKMAVFADLLREAEATCGKLEAASCQ